MIPSSRIEKVKLDQQAIDAEIVGDVYIRIRGNHLPIDPANIKKAVRAARRQRDRERARDRRRLCSLDDEMLPQLMSDAKDPSEEIEKKEQCETVLRELAKYSERDRDIFLRRSGMYGEYTLKEVADLHGLSCQRVDQIYKQLKEQLRVRLKNRLM